MCLRSLTAELLSMAAGNRPVQKTGADMVARGIFKEPELCLATGGEMPQASDGNGAGSNVTGVAFFIIP